MADLIPSQARKAAAAPRNENEARIARARAGHAALVQAFAPKPVRKSAAPAAPVSTSFVSGFGGSSNMVEATPTKVAKADPLAALPERARRAAERLPDGTKTLLARIHEVHAKTGERVTFSRADAGAVMGLPGDAAGRAVDAMVTAGLIKPSFNSLGGVSGYVPAILN